MSTLRDKRCNMAYSKSPQPKADMTRKTKALNLALIIIAWGCLFYMAQSDIFTTRYYGLPILFLLVALASAFFPVPINVLVLLAGQSADARAVVAAAACATFPSYLLEYLIYQFIIRRGQVLDIKNLKIAPKLFAGFIKYPFATLAVTSFLPMPSEPIRFYAISTRYNKFRFAFAGMLGRAFRFAMLVGVGVLMGTPTWLIVAVMLLPVVLGVAGYFYKRAQTRKESMYEF